jgi:UDP-N-acetylmuramate dehydrogenase
MFSLRAFNTFGIEASASQFVEISSLEQYVSLLKSGEFAQVPHLFLGGGSNVLLTKNQEALVVKISILGISILKEDADFIWVQSGAGVVWDEFVQYVVNQGWSGLENLSLIPGTVGAAPMQNIGAYGVEIKDTFESLEALNLHTLAVEIFDAKACEFGYRESFFKRSGKGQYLISSVTFKLAKKPCVKTSYGAIQEVLATKGITQPSIREVADAVIEIRKSKLPDPKDIGNSGSFFKNPTVSASDAARLISENPGIPHYPVEGSAEVKFPAGWFIEKAGWKGFRRGDAGVHAKQALVLVNYGEAKGEEILALSEEIRQSIKEKFGVALETEVNIL